MVVPPMLEYTQMVVEHDRSPAHWSSEINAYR